MTETEALDTGQLDAGASESGPLAANAGRLALGIAGMALTIIPALAISVQFDPAVFGSWVGVLMMAAIPFQIVMGLIWKTQYPGWVGALPQPIKGLAIVGLMAVASSIVAPLTIALVGGAVTPPIPFTVMFIIMNVLATFWVVAVFQAWPVSTIAKGPLAVGLGTLALSYGVAWVAFRLCFDFSGMAGAPFYIESLDPRGAFGAWDALSFAVCTVTVIVALVLFDFWPMSAVAGKVPALGAQPVFGLMTGSFVLVVTSLIWWLGVVAGGMDPVDFMVRIPVSGLFGLFILLFLFQAGPWSGMAQPVKGVALTVIAGGLAMVMYEVYAFAALHLVGPMPSGAPTYALDLWIATAMLGVTFPIIVAFAEGFAFWPLRRD